MKSEPSTYSIDDLKKDKKSPWDGVRNYQARNFMRDDMKKGDAILFYHSNCDVPGVHGIAEVCRESYPDMTQFDVKSKYFDEKASADNPRWYLVDVCFKRRLTQPVSLETIKADAILSQMIVARRGNRLSITPVTKKQFDRILKLSK